MSILIKEDYVNPEIPLWASNGSGGGPLIFIADIAVTGLGGLNYNDTVTVASFPIPNEISVGDDFIIDLQVLPEDFDLSPVALYPLAGNIEYVVFFTDDGVLGSYGNTTSVFAGRNSGTSESVFSPCPIRVIANRGVNASDINVVIRNKIPDSSLVVSSVGLGRISFIKIGTGLITP